MNGKPRLRLEFIHWNCHCRLVFQWRVGMISDFGSRIPTPFQCLIMSMMNGKTRMKLELIHWNCHGWFWLQDPHISHQDCVCFDCLARDLIFVAVKLTSGWILSLMVYYCCELNIYWSVAFQFCPARAFLWFNDHSDRVQGVCVASWRSWCFNFNTKDLFTSYTVQIEKRILKSRVTRDSVKTPAITKSLTSQWKSD